MSLLRSIGAWLFSASATATTLEAKAPALESSSGKSAAAPVRRAHRFGIEASAKNNGMSQWDPARRDDMNEEYLRSIYDVMERAFNLHANNADVRGHNQGRTARALGAGVVWQACPLPLEIGLDAAATDKICAELNRKRALHSEAGGFDASGKNQSEGLLQIKYMLTARVLGSCLAHRVWRNEPGAILPLQIELIPGSRISTPYGRQGDPLIHFGIEYADEYRSRVTGWHVRRVPKTIGDASVSIPEWDFIPVEDGSLFELIEPAGIDRALPECIAVMRLIFNRGQMIEACVEAARNHASYHMIIEVAPGHNPFDETADAADGTTQVCDALSEGWQMVDGVKVYRAFNGEKATMTTAVLPAPDFRGFNDVCDERMTRGLNTRKSEFTRTVDTSYSGGMQERQIDTPGVQQMRENFTCAWNKIHQWFLDACFVTGAVEMPGYSAETRVYWCQARKEFPGELPLNPVDFRNAQNLALASGQTDDITEAEAMGTNYEVTTRNRAKAYKIRRAAEELEKLPPGTLEPTSDLPVVQDKVTEEEPASGEGEAQKPGVKANNGFRARYAYAQSNVKAVSA